MSTQEFFVTLIKASEKAANIARVCRSNEKLFELLIQEKTEEDGKNPRFFKDFKTLADVLIQQAIKHDVAKSFPDIRDNIRGEESNQFENTLGESVDIEICDFETTKSMLRKVLDGNDSAALALAQEIHKDVDINESLPEIDEKLDYSKLGIWIDPIDGTAQYIEGVHVTSDIPNIDESGLKCATVLIGVYDKETHKPIFGVINQPFDKNNDGGDSYVSKIFWGASFNKLNINNICEKAEKNSNKIAIISSSESRKNTLEMGGYQTVTANGAGYKILKVIEDDANIYFLSNGSTFKYDTCAGQAILNSLGGDIIDLMASIKQKRPVSITYRDDENKCNQNGLIAYRNVIHLINLIPSFL